MFLLLTHTFTIDHSVLAGVKICAGSVAKVDQTKL